MAVCASVTQPPARILLSPFLSSLLGPLDMSGKLTMKCCTSVVLLSRTICKMFGNCSIAEGGMESFHCIAGVDGMLACLSSS